MSEPEIENNEEIKKLRRELKDIEVEHDVIRERSKELYQERDLKKTRLREIKKKIFFCADYITYKKDNYRRYAKIISRTDEGLKILMIISEEKEYSDLDSVPYEFYIINKSHYHHKRDINLKTAKILTEEEFNTFRKKVAETLLSH